MLDTLVEDLGHLHETERLAPDLIFFTGDVAFGQPVSGPGDMAAQYKLAHEFFGRIRHAFGVGHEIPDENLFIVPGNHDVNRRRVLPSDAEYLERQKDIHEVDKIINEAGAQWKSISGRLTEYRTFLSDNGYHHLLTHPEHLIFAANRQVKGINLGIAGLNSAWSCFRDGEKGRLWLCGNWQISRLRSELRDSHLTVLLMHHPVNWLTDYEDPVVNPLIENRFDFFLHGHEHDVWVDEKPNGHTRIAAAACYDRSDKENGYNIVQLDLDTGKGTVWLREYDRKGGAWKPRIVPQRTDNEGRWSLENGRYHNSTAKAVSAPAAVSMAPANYPTLRRVYLPQPPIGRDADREAALTILRDSRALLLHGAPGQGKTALARFIAVSPEADSLYPDGVFEVDLQNEKQIGNISKQIGSALGDADTANPLALLASKRALIILDSFEFILRSNETDQVRRFLDNLIDSLFGGSRIIITSQDYFDKAGLVPKRVKGLDRESAVKLFHRESYYFYKDEDEDKVADFVSDNLGGHALSIKLVARYSFHASKVELGVLNRLWKEKFSDIAKFPHTLDDKTLITSFELSYATLTSEEKQFFLAMSLLPDGILGSFIKDIWGEKETAAYESFATLEKRSLLEGEERMWKMLGPIFLYAQEKRRAIESDRNNPLYEGLHQNINLIDRFYYDFVQTYAPQSTDEDPRDKNRRIREHFHNIHAFLDRRIEPSTEPMTLAAAESVLALYWAYHNNLSGYRNAITSAEDAVYYFDKAANVFSINNQQDKVMRCRYCGGNILWLRGDIDRARPYFDEVLNSSQSSSDIKLECQRAFAHFEYKIGSIPKAVAHYEQYVKDSYTAGEANAPTYRLRCWTGLLDAYRKLEMFDEAGECFEKAMAEAQDVPPSVRGNIIRGFAYALLVQGKLPEAEARYVEALEIFRGVSPFGEAHCRRGLGDVYVKTNRLDQAGREFNHAIKLYEEARKNPSLGVGLVELGLGRLCLALTDVGSAARHLSKAIKLFNPQNLNEPFEQAQAYELMADTLRRSGDVHGALGNYQLALQLYQRTGCSKAASRVSKAISVIEALK